MKDKEKSSHRLLTTRDAALRCGVTVPTLKQWIRHGKLRAFQTPGGHYRIDPTEFARFLQREGITAAPSPPPAEPSVLVVDDEPGILHILVELLGGSPRHYKVETATDGYEALIKVGAFRPAVVLLDVVMPGMDGIEVCRRLKAMPETRDAKIIGMTGFPNLVPAMLGAGVDVCLTKPLDLPRLQDELERLLGS